jgi:hypothetical protein
MNLTYQVFKFQNFQLDSIKIDISGIGCEDVDWLYLLMMWSRGVLFT